jgi:hypothetical protein
MFIAGAAALLGGCKATDSSVSADPSKSPAAESRPAADTATVPAGTPISVRLLQTVTSASARPGDTFEAELAAPVVVNGETVFAKDARARGRVVSAKASGRLKNPGYVRLTLAAIQSPDGSWTNVDVTSLSAKGKSHTRRNATLIGGGAGLGALIGGIAGGGKGAAIGAGAGAGAGTMGAYATGKKDVSFPAEHRLTFRTARQIVVRTAGRTTRA